MVDAYFDETDNSDMEMSALCERLEGSPTQVAVTAVLTKLYASGKPYVFASDDDGIIEIIGYQAR